MVQLRASYFPVNAFKFSSQWLQRYITTMNAANVKNVLRSSTTNCDKLRHPIRDVHKITIVDGVTLSKMEINFMQRIYCATDIY